MSREVFLYQLLRVKQAWVHYVVGEMCYLCCAMAGRRLCEMVTSGAAVGGIRSKKPGIAYVPGS